MKDDFLDRFEENIKEMERLKMAMGMNPHPKLMRYVLGWIVLGPVLFVLLFLLLDWAVPLSSIPDSVYDIATNAVIAACCLIAYCIFTRPFVHRGGETSNIKWNLLIFGGVQIISAVIMCNSFHILMVVFPLVAYVIARQLTNKWILDNWKALERFMNQLKYADNMEETEGNAMKREFERQMEQVARGGRRAPSVILAWLGYFVFGWLIWVALFELLDCFKIIPETLDAGFYILADISNAVIFLCTYLFFAYRFIKKGGSSSKVKGFHFAFSSMQVIFMLSISELSAISVLSCVLSIIAGWKLTRAWFNATTGKYNPI